MRQNLRILGGKEWQRAMQGAPATSAARACEFADRLSALPEALFDLVLKRVASGAWTKQCETYDVLLKLVTSAFEDLCRFRLVAKWVLHADKQREYFYDVVWKLWALRNVQDLQRPSQNNGIADLLNRISTGSLEHLSFTKDMELYTTMLTLFDRNMDKIKRFLRHNKRRRKKVAKELAQLEVYPAPAAPTA